MVELSGFRNNRGTKDRHWLKSEEVSMLIAESERGCQQEKTNLEHE